MRQHYLMFTLFMILVAVLFFMVSSALIGKKIAQVTSYDKKIKVAQEKLNSAKIMDQQLSQFAMIIQNSLTKTKIFSPTEVNAFVKTLANLADNNQIAVIAIYPKEVQASVNLVEQQYIMELNTTYIQLGQFLAALEALDNIVKINTLDVSPQTITDTQKKITTGPRVARYKVTLELSVFKVQKEA